jgi:O-antigen ligase
VLIYIGVVLLLSGLVLVKAGTIVYVFLTWSALAILVAFVFQWNKKLVFISSVKDRGVLALFNGFYLLVLFQFWQLVQLIFQTSQNTQATFDSLILGLGFTALILLMSTRHWSQSTKRLLIFSIIALGAVQSLYGLWVFFTQSNSILWMEKVFYLDKPTGTFVNANHYCAYLALILILLVSYFTCRSNTSPSSKRQSPHINFIQFIEQIYSPFGLAFVLLLFAILSTRSIGGIGSLIIVFSAVIFGFGYKKIAKFKLLLCILFVTSIVAFIVLSSDYLTFIQELKGLQFTFERRLSLSQAGLRMSVDNWFFGVGGGAFYSSFSQYRDLNVGNSFYHFAHNDYLHFWAEQGLIGVMILVAMIVQCIGVNLKVLQQSKNTYRRTFAYTSIYSTIMLGFHSMVDFPLQIPAYTALYLVVLFFNVMTYQEKTI